MDDKKLRIPDIVAIASVSVFFVALFLPWFTVSINGDSSGVLSGAGFPDGTVTGWDAGLFWSFVPLLLGIGLLTLLLLSRLAPDVALPDLPAYLPLALGAAAAALVLLKALVGYDAPAGSAVDLFDITVDVSRSVGLLVALLASLGMTAAGILATHTTNAIHTGAGATTPPHTF